MCSLMCRIMYWDSICRLVTRGGILVGIFTWKMPSQNCDYDKRGGGWQVISVICLFLYLKYIDGFSSPIAGGGRWSHPAIARKMNWCKRLEVSIKEALELPRKLRSPMISSFPISIHQSCSLVSYIWVWWVWRISCCYSSFST